MTRSMLGQVGRYAALPAKRGQIARSLQAGPCLPGGLLRSIRSQRGLSMMLAADALGIGSCYIGQGWPAFADPYGQEVLKKWRIPTDHYAVMQLVLGYPREGDRHPTPKPRKEDRVLYIREK